MKILDFFKKDAKKRKIQEDNSPHETILEDEMGVIPYEVNIVVPSYYSTEPLVQWCIAERNGAFYLQKWTMAGKMREWTVPFAIVSAINVKGIENFHEDGDVIAITETKHDSLDRHMLFYQDSKGRTLFFKVNSEFFDGDALFIATVDGIAIRYYWGDDFYQYCDFGDEFTLNIFDDETFLLGSNFIDIEDIQWKEKAIFSDD